MRAECKLSSIIKSYMIEHRVARQFTKHSMYFSQFNRSFFCCFCFSGQLSMRLTSLVSKLESVSRFSRPPVSQSLITFLYTMRARCHFYDGRYVIDVHIRRLDRQSTHAENKSFFYPFLFSLSLTSALL